MKQRRASSTLATIASAALKAGLPALWLLSAGAAHAQATPLKAGDLTVRLGAAGVLFNSGGKFKVAGQPLPGADLKASDSVTAAAEVDYSVTRALSLSLTVGFPPKTHADGRGVLAPVGRLGEIRYGPAAALVKYHFSGLGPVQPWVGGGATRMSIFSNTDGAVQNLKVDGHWGSVLQVGTDVMLTPKWGLYTSATRMFLHTNGAGSFSGLPITARIKLDPTILQGGLAYRF